MGPLRRGIAGAGGAAEGTAGTGGAVEVVKAGVHWCVQLGLGIGLGEF